MKKFRGKRRHFRNLQQKVTAEHSKLDFGKASWFNLWHIHLDFKGNGNRSIKLRRAYIKAHLTLYKGLAVKLEASEMSFQSWVSVDIADAGSDAIYIHTPNPIEDNFPLMLENIDWEADVPFYFRDLINFKEFEVGRYDSGTDASYVIQLKRNKIKV